MPHLVDIDIFILSLSNHVSPDQSPHVAAEDKQIHSDQYQSHRRSHPLHGRALKCLADVDGCYREANIGENEGIPAHRERHCPPAY